MLSGEALLFLYSRVSARLFMLFRTASVSLAHAKSEPEARGPEDYDAPLEWRAPSDDYSAAMAIRSFAVSTSSTLKSAVSATPYCSRAFSADTRPRATSSATFAAGRLRGSP